MSKRLKTIVLISSFVLVGFIVGLLLLTMIGNISSIEVYDFRVYEMPNNVIDVNEVGGNKRYEIYLKAQRNQNVYSLEDVYRTTRFVDFSFVSEDDSIAVVEGATNGNGESFYQIVAKKVGVVNITVARIELDEMGNEISVQENYDLFEVVAYRELSSCDMYLLSPSNNYKEIKVYSSASNSQFAVGFVSTDPSVAVVVEKDDKYYINALSAGKTKITAYCVDNAEINDSFEVHVYDNQANDLIFIDKNGNEITQGTIYDDGTYYSFGYKLVSNADQVVNAGSVKLVSYSKTPIEIKNWSAFVTNQDELSPFDLDSGVKLDIDSQTIFLKKSYVNSFSETTAISEIPQVLGSVTLAITDNVDDEEVVLGQFTLSINVLHQTQVDIEFEISNTPQFLDNYKNVYHSTSSTIEWKGFKLNNNYTALSGDDIEINDITTIYACEGMAKTYYIRAWKVYNNGDRELSIISDLTTTMSNVNFKSSPDANYFIIEVTDPTAYAYIKIFNVKIEINPLTLDIKNSRVYTNTDGIYRYTYWDIRLKDKNEKTNYLGQIIGFVS